MAYTYRCRDYPGMEACPGSFTAESADEVMNHIELHAKAAHGEDPKQWSAHDRRQLQALIVAG
jgi:predicted small metal-binding protein